ncbi:amidohydrolase family protein [Sphingobium phenoxybenzoativorans]|uniref:amidohydrolase family protein n=1 Tax=Sphingobium phenoxybenzoativorans TaxID=1592790 RepID=UPI0008733A90|nr:amidohydrolase family protein [Sphingobium phenoxybenzoativorans]
MKAGIVRLVGASILAALCAGLAAAQDFHDRRTVQFPDQATSDNPQRIPVIPKKQGFDGTLVLKGGRIFDSVKSAAYPGSLVITQNKVAAVLPAGSTDWPADATVMDVTGKTVMPGMIDMHVHIYSPNVTSSDTPADLKAMEGYAVLRGLTNLRYSLENGITSVRDMSGVMNASYILSEWLEKDMSPGPRVFAAGHIITATGGHAAERSSTYSAIYVREADGADDWRKAVREMFKMGASHIKIASHFAPGEVKAAVEEAHNLGLKVTCDCETIYTQMAVEAGVDSIEHPLPRTDETIKLMAKKGVAAIPTMQTYQDLFDMRGAYTGSPSRRFSMTSQSNFDMLKKFIAAGVTIGVGTDSLGLPAFEKSPNYYIAELKFLQKAGYTPAKALIAATRTNAQIMDMGDKLGTLEPGKLADVIVVDGRPDENLDDLAKVETVVRNGNIVIKDGRLFVPRHEPKPLLKPSPPETLR